MTLARIFIADDQEIIRHGLQLVLARQAGWELVGEAENGRKAVEEIVRLRPDVAILDVGMPDLNGFEVTRQVKKEAPQTRVVILTNYDTDDAVREALAAGAESYILKGDAIAEIVKAVQALLQNKPYFSGKIARIVLDGYLQSEGPAAGGAAGTGEAGGRLTDREREIVQMLAEGRSNKEVAGALSLSVKTVETHRANIMRKMNFVSIVELVRYAIRNKMIQP